MTKQFITKIPVIAWALKNRFVRFGSVGFSGTLINLGILYLGQEYLFKAVESDDMRLNLALSLAIFCATISNFTLNRMWTWADRKQELDKHFLFQLGQYFVACWLAIALQFLITKLLAAHVFYLVANFAAIALASIVNFLVNDYWTFGARKNGPVNDVN